MPKKTTKPYVLHITATAVYTVKARNIREAIMKADARSLVSKATQGLITLPNGQIIPLLATTTTTPPKA